MRWFNYVLLAAFFVVMTGLFLWRARTSRNVHTIALDLSRSVPSPLAVASAGINVQHLLIERPRRPRTHRIVDSII